MVSLFDKLEIIIYAITKERYDKYKMTYFMSYQNITRGNRFQKENKKLNNYRYEYNIIN